MEKFLNLSQVAKLICKKSHSWLSKRLKNGAQTEKDAIVIAESFELLAQLATREAKRLRVEAEKLRVETLSSYSVDVRINELEQQGHVKRQAAPRPNINKAAAKPVDDDDDDDFGI